MKRELRQLTDRRPGLPPPKFSLLSLLLLIFGLAVLLVIGKYLGPVAAFVSIIVGLSIFAHMASTSIGGRLRANGAQPLVFDDDDVEQSSLHMVQPTKAQTSDFAPTTQLSQQTPLERKPIYRAVILGAVSFAIVGGAILTIVMWDRLAVVNVFFGMFSCAVLGAVFGSLVSSFYQVVRVALREAQQES